MNTQTAITIGVTGARGFVGGHLVAALLPRANTSIRVLTRQTATPDPFSRHPVVQTFVGDLADRSSLQGFLQGLDCLVNLAHPETATDTAVAHLGDQFAEACCVASVARVIHVSTATVVGTTPVTQVNEATPCHPTTIYERRKWLMEQRLAAGLAGKVDFAVLRPTAVFGPNSQNLLKVMHTVASSPAWQRRLLRFFHGRRRMHLLPVEDLVLVILHLLFSTSPLGARTYIVACDDQPDNHYQAVDAWLGREFGKPMPLASPALPGALQKLILRLAGRTQTDPSLCFDESELRTLGIRSGSDFIGAVQRFARWYAAENKGVRS